jgi:hypothetical protein
MNIGFELRTAHSGRISRTLNLKVGSNRNEMIFAMTQGTAVASECFSSVVDRREQRHVF